MHHSFTQVQTNQIQEEEEETRKTEKIPISPYHGRIRDHSKWEKKKENSTIEVVELKI